MPRRRHDVIDFFAIPQDDTALLSHYGDEEAMSFLWELAIPQVERIAGKFVGRYPWICHDDLSQSILVEFPKIVARYDPQIAYERGITWNKYLYFSFYRAAQDTLRREDPLGVQIPQKAKYPAWFRFSDVTDCNNLIEAIILDGIEKIDRGDPCVLEPPDESNIAEHALKQVIPRTGEYHDALYHGGINW